MKILVCDDFPLCRRIVSAILGTQGHQVETAYDGQDALEKIQTHPNSFDVLITDNRMPKLTGVELVDELRKMHVPIKVIMASMFITPLDTAVWKRLRLDGVLQKPFSEDELLDCVGKLG